VTRSHDASGETWEEPRNITAEAKIPEEGVFLSILAIGGGIQASSGRLIAQGYGEQCFGSTPADRAGKCNRTAPADPADPFSESATTWSEINHVVFSDDAGLTWKSSRNFGV